MPFGKTKTKHAKLFVIALLFGMVLLPSESYATTEIDSFAELETCVTDSTQTECVLSGDFEFSNSLTISRNLTISGNATLSRAASYDGGLFSIAAGANVTLQGITVDGGAPGWEKDLDPEQDDDYRRITQDGRVCNTIFSLNQDSYEMRDGFVVPSLHAKMRIEIINDKPHFIVMADSVIFPYREVDKKPTTQEAAIRKSGWHDEMTLEEDIDVFTSPSGASNFVLGGASNGWAVWKTEDGETLDEVVASDAENSVSQGAANE